MQCENCGGNLPHASSSKTQRCDLCEAFRCTKVSWKGVSRIKLLAGRTRIPCPACSQELRFGKLKKAKVLHCTACFGLLMTTGAFREMLRKQHTQAAEADQTPQAVEGSSFRPSVPCPQCNTLMDFHPYHGPGDVLIESCDHCNLIWFDQGAAYEHSMESTMELPLANS